MKYPDQESAQLEFKKEVPTKQQIVKTMVAFCNHFGGKLILGIDDDREIFGVPESDIDDLSDQLQKSIYQSATPTILPLIYTQRLGEKIVLVLEVSSGMNKPYFVTSLGMNEGVFIRAGAHTVKADAVFIRELAWRSKGFSVDEMPVYAANIEEINLESFKNFLEKNRQEFQVKKIQDQLKHYKLLIEEHGKIYPTLAGLLLFGKTPERYYPEAFIICTHFSGLADRSALASLDCTGTLMSQVDTAINFVSSRLNHSFEIKKTRRIEKLEMPEVAVREIIINAVVHRDYSLPGPIKISIFDDRVEIFSPGGFAGPISTDDLEMGLTYIRNHAICRIFREAGYIEKLGSGFLTLFKTFRENFLPRPVVIEGDRFIKCVLPRVSSLKRSERSGNLEHKKQPSTLLMDLFYSQDLISIPEAMAYLNISRPTAGRYLSQLVKLGKVERLGQGPSVRYRKI